MTSEEFKATVGKGTIDQLLEVQARFSDAAGISRTMAIVMVLEDTVAPLLNRQSGTKLLKNIFARMGLKYGSNAEERVNALGGISESAWVVGFQFIGRKVQEMLGLSEEDFKKLVLADVITAWSTSDQQIRKVIEGIAEGVIG